MKCRRKFRGKFTGVTVLHRNKIHDIVSKVRTTGVLMIEGKPKVSSFMQEQLILTHVLGRCSAVFQATDRRRKPLRMFSNRLLQLSIQPKIPWKPWTVCLVSVSYVVIYGHCVRKKCNCYWSNVLYNVKWPNIHIYSARTILCKSKM
jgi:hypothetical protein